MRGRERASIRGQSPSGGGEGGEGCDEVSTARAGGCGASLLMAVLTDVWYRGIDKLGWGAGCWPCRRGCNGGEAAVCAVLCCPKRRGCSIGGEVDVWGMCPANVCPALEAAASVTTPCPSFEVAAPVCSENRCPSFEVACILGSP